MAVTEQPAAIDEAQARRVHEPGRRRARRDAQRGARRDRRPARPLQGDGRRRAARRRRELAERTGTTERYVREWLNAQAAGGYVDLRRRRRGRYTLPPEQALALADESSPASCRGAFQGSHVGSCATSRRSRGVHERRRRRLARARPRPLRGHRALLPPRLQRATSSTRGSRRSTASTAKLERRRARRRRRLRPRRLDDPHGARRSRRRRSSASTTTPASIEAARERAADAGVADRVALRGRAGRGRSPASGYDLVTILRLPARHGRPGRRRAPRARARSTPDGTWMIVEPFAGDQRRGQPQPGRPRLLRRPRRCVCTPASLSQEVGLGARRAGRRGAPRATSSTAGGFTRFRRATETPFNLVLEARP